MKTPSREERRQFEEAHAEGLHDTAPREFCPSCEELSPFERERRWNLTVEHKLDVRETSYRTIFGRMIGGYEAFCTCGWAGEFRSSQAAAEEDTFRHRITEANNA